MRYETGFLDRTVTLGDAVYRYQVYVPLEFTPTRQWPVILFLHGAGEVGTDGLLPTEVGLGSALRRYRTRFPALVVFPQLREHSFWWDAMEAQALAALAQTVQEFQGDPQRLYLTGISRGGYGTWYIASRHPGKFAALAPVCGGLVRPYAMRPAHVAQMLDSTDPYAELAQRIGSTPAWLFHGDADNIIPVNESRRIQQALITAGNPVRYTEYAGVGHDSWTPAYAEPEFMPWLLAQRKE